MIDILSWILISIGSFFSFTGAMGMIRMPNFYARLHPAGLSDSIGAPMILIGFAIQYGFTITTLKILLLAIFFLITGPTSTYALANAALFTGPKPEADVIEDKPKKKKPTTKRKKKTT